MWLHCEDCDRIEKEPFDVGGKCTCGGIFIEVDEQTAAEVSASQGTQDESNNNDLDPD